MKNNILNKSILLVIFCLLNLSIAQSEQFNFNVTEIEISDNGNLIKGLKRGIIETDNGILINANKFVYNKTTNTVKAQGKVKIEDVVNNYIIFSDKATYKKNEEIVFTEGNSKGIDDKNRIITSDKITYNKTTNTVKAQGKVKIEDDENEFKIKSEKIFYLIEDKKIFSEGQTDMNIEKKYNVKSNDLNYLIESNQIFSNKKSVIEDNNNQIYYLDEFLFLKESEIL